MKHILQEVGKTGIILFISICLGFGLLCLVHMLPVDKMYQNVVASKDILQSYGEVVTGYRSTALDNYTDSIMLNQAICPIDTSIVDKVMNNWQVNYFRGYEQPENLIRYLQGEDKYQYQSYSHYWGGWQMVLKPLLLIFDFSDIKVLNLILQSMCIIFVILELIRRQQSQIVIPFFISIITIMPFATALSIQLCDVFYITVLGIIVLLRKYERLEKNGIIYFFLILGILTSYFDFLTYPFLSCGMPLVVWMVLRENTFIVKMIEMIRNSAMWCIGYVGMWVGKWILGSILWPQANSFEEALRSIQYRGSNMTGVDRINAFDVLISNLYIYLRKPTILIIGLSVIYFFIIIMGNRNIWKVEWKNKLLESMLYGIVCLYPMIWYILATNHSYEHTFMAFRELGIAVFAGLCLLAQWSVNKKYT